MSKSIRCTILRGGTSKGIYLRESDLPVDAAAREKVILSIFGSPDRRQIDGLGGADPLTSKVCIVGPPPMAWQWCSQPVEGFLARCLVECLAKLGDARRTELGKF